MGKKAGEKTLVEKAVEAVDKMIHPEAAQPNEEKVESSPEPAAEESAEMQTMGKKKTAPSAKSGELKKFDKFKKGSEQ